MPIKPRLKMPKMVFFFLVFLFAETLSLAQCIDEKSRYDRLSQISSNANNLDIIYQLNLLISESKKCGFTNDSIYAKCLHVLGRTFWYENKLDSAIFFTKQAIKINSRESPLVRRANLCHSYYNLASIYMQRGELTKSITELDNAIRFGLQFPEKIASVADSYCLQASIYMSIGDYQKTVFASVRAFEYAVGISRYDLMAKSQIEKAQALIELNDLSQSDDALRQALHYARTSSEFSLNGSIYSLLAELRRKQNRPSEVVENYLKAFQIYKRAQFNYGCGQSASDLGFYYSHYAKNSDQALKYYLIALKYIDHDALRAMTLDHIGEISRQKGDFDNALMYSQKAFATAKLISLETDFIHNPSSEMLRPILDKSAILSIIQSKADTWLAYAKHTNNDRAKLKNALNTYMLADTMIDYMRWEHTGNVSKLFWREKTRAMYERAIETCYLLNDPANAFYFFEKSRAVMLNDQLNELGASQLLSLKDQEKERILKQKVTALQNELAEKEQDLKAAAGLRTQLFTAQEAYESFIKQLETTSPQYYAYKYENLVPDISQFKSKVLGENQTFVSYFVGDSALYGLAISQRNLSFKKLKLAEYLTCNAQFQKLIGNRDLQNRQFSDYLRITNQLYHIFFKPFSIASDSRVIVSPDGSFLPFGALSSSPSSPEYLVKKYAFSYTYSAGYLAKRSRSVAGIFSTKTFLGLSPVAFAPKLSLAALPGSDAVLNFIDDHFLFSKTLTGADASRSAFVKNLPDYSIVQLLTHATADSAGTIPTLYFADSTLKLSEFTAGHRSNTELIVLSACRTGVGKNQRGEGVFSLARGFAGIGIPSTLTTLWSVENDPVYALTKLFYAELAEDLPLDIALQNAQNEWLKTASASGTLPYAWAGMVLVGNSEPVYMGISKLHAYTAMGIFIALTVFVAIILRRRKFAAK